MRLMRSLCNNCLTGENQWDPLPDMTEIRSDFSAVTFGSSVFAIGGFNGTDVLGRVEVFNVEEQMWRPYTSLTTPRSGTRCMSKPNHPYTCHGTGLSCMRTRCTFWVGTMEPRGCAQWNVSPQDLLEPGQGGTR